MNETATPSSPKLRHARVDPSWVDIYGHMNMAFYVKLFDDLGHDILSEYGLGKRYTHDFGFGLFTIEANIRYLKEILADAPLTVSLKIGKADGKRLWTSLDMRHAEEGYVAATMEQLAINVSLITRRAVPFPPHLDSILKPYRG